jgi:hypothetical protein
VAKVVEKTWSGEALQYDWLSMKNANRSKTFRMHFFVLDEMLDALLDVFCLPKTVAFYQHLELTKFVAAHDLQIGASNLTAEGGRFKDRLYMKAP